MKKNVQKSECELILNLIRLNFFFFTIYVINNYNTNKNRSIKSLTEDSHESEAQ